MGWPISPVFPAGGGVYKSKEMNGIPADTFAKKVELFLAEIGWVVFNLIVAQSVRPNLFVEFSQNKNSYIWQGKIAI